MGINTMINQTKEDLVKLINESLKKGVPIICVGMILNELRNEIQANVNLVLDREKQMEKEHEQEEEIKEGE